MIDVRNLAKHYSPAAGLRALLSRADSAPTRAVDGVSFSIRAGETLGLVGESGCGKSTTGRMLVGLEQPTAGDVAIDGVDAGALRKADRKAFHRRAQMVFQDPYGSLNPQHMIGEIVARPLIYQRIGDRAEVDRRVRDALAAVGLAPADAYLRKFPHELSGGQRQRVCIARALILEPSFLVADEPASMLDVSIKWGVIRLLRSLARERGIAMLYITHDLATVGAICDKLAIMYLGRIVEIGPVSEILTQPRHPYTQALIASIPSADPDVRRAPPLIKSSAPDASKSAAGCNFKPRCMRADARCGGEAPSLTQEGARAVACFHADSAPAELAMTR